MADTGWLNADIAESINTGDPEWTTPTQAITQNDDWAEATFSAKTNSDTLRLTDFDCAIPVGNQIDGIEVQIDKYMEELGAVQDNSVRLCLSGSPIGNNKYKGGNWPTSDTDTYYLYPQSGGPTDKWGTSITRDDVNNTTFGVQIICQSTQFFGVAYVDHIQIKVYYSAAGSGILKANSKILKTGTGILYVPT